MKDSRLKDLNFRTLLQYGGQPVIQFRYDPPLACTGYCVKCEEGHDQAIGRHRLDFMSHGADTSDFVQLLGPMSSGTSGHRVGAPVMFVLESPGGWGVNNVQLPFRGFKKSPPLRHYYWTTGLEEWPRSVGRGSNMYGDYFAYLLERFGFRSAYFTNAVKCRLRPGHGGRLTSAYPKAVIRMCADQYLKNELTAVRPKMLFAFGHKAFDILGDSGILDWSKLTFGTEVTLLLHPMQRRNSRADFVKENNRRIQRALGTTGLDC